MTFSLRLHTTLQDPRRNFGLDLVRVVAIGMVFYSHAVRGMVKGVLIGNVAVELFFVLSGFLVGRYFFTGGQEYNSSFAFKFMAKRWLRTLPLYYAVIILKILLTKHTFLESWRYFVFIQNYNSLSFFSVSWSLSIEEWFYLLLPLMAALIIRRIANVGRIIAFIGIVYCIELFLRAYYVLNDQMPWETITATIHLRMDSLLTGLALVFIKYEYAAFYSKLRSIWVFGFGALMIGLYLYFFASTYLASQINTVMFFRVFGFVLLSISMALLFPFIESISVSREKLFGRLINGVVVTGSILTYSFYLVHTEVIEWFSALQIRLMAKVAGAFIVSVLLSWLLYLFIEKPFLNMKNKIKMDRN